LNKDVAFRYKELLDLFSRYENGEVSDSMYRHGLYYKKNFGVSIPVIDQIAGQFQLSSELASFLWKQEERESKLLALRLFDYNSFIDPYLEDLIQGIENSELAEQAALHFLVNLTHSIEIANSLIKNNNENCILAGLILISKLAQTRKNLDNSAFIQIINQLKTLKLNITLHQKRGLSRALLQIGLRNNELKQQVVHFIDEQFNENSEYKNWLEQEVKYFL